MGEMLKCTSMSSNHSDTSGRRADEAFEAARAGDLERLSSILDQGVPATLCNDTGDSLLMLAAYHGHEPCVARLLERGAAPDQLNAKGQHPLAGVCFKGNLGVTRMLLDAGANPEGCTDAARSPLMYAAMYNHQALTRLLLERGADAERRNSDGMRALELAEEMRAVHTVGLLRAASGDA
jgi:ankyrin repeat protein